MRRKARIVGARCPACGCEDTGAPLYDPGFAYIAKQRRDDGMLIFGYGSILDAETLRHPTRCLVCDSEGVLLSVEPV